MAFRDAVTFEISAAGLCQSGVRPLEPHGEDEGVSVNFTPTTVKTVMGAAGIAAVGAFAAATAYAATPNIQGFGTSESLIDGPMVPPTR